MPFDRAAARSSPLADDDTEGLDGTLLRCQAEGRDLIPRHFQVFRRLVAEMEALVRNGEYASAAVHGELSALYAISRHCGLFASADLERLLLAIGRNTVPAPSGLTYRRAQGSPRHVLHVSTRVMPVGGHSRMLWRWIQQDSGRIHSVALTRQTKHVPQILKDAVAGTGGRVFRVNRAIGGMIAWARKLRKVAVAVDLVVLHTFNDDVIPIIALANREGLPPVLFCDHADHIFWLGAGVSDIVLSLRGSGMRIARERRGIAAERSILLPTILAPARRSLSRSEAKARLGLPDDSVLLLSVARALKYGNIGALSYADAHAPILERYENAYLIVVGPADRSGWAAAAERTGGRIISVGEREDTAEYYQAADIYVDSFPFVSTTSLLEAGSLGTALVSFFPYSEASAILGADAPGLDGTLLVARDSRRYEAILSRLIEDERYRLDVGEATRSRIAELHVGASWQRRLTEIYDLAAKLGGSPTRPTIADEMSVGEPDVYIPRIHGAADPSDGTDGDIDRMIESLIRVMPLPERLLQWGRLARRPDGFCHVGRVAGLKYLAPEWLVGRVRSEPWAGV
jgi:hypothetical protein